MDKVAKIQQDYMENREFFITNAGNEYHQNKERSLTKLFVPTLYVDENDVRRVIGYELCDLYLLRYFIMTPTEIYDDDDAPTGQFTWMKMTLTINDEYTRIQVLFAGLANVGEFQGEPLEVYDDEDRQFDVLVLSGTDQGFMPIRLEKLTLREAKALAQ